LEIIPIAVDVMKNMAPNPRRLAAGLVRGHGRLRHSKREERKRDPGAESEEDEGLRVAEAIDDDPGKQATQRRADALHGRDGFLREVETTCPTHEIGEDEQREGAEDTSANTIEGLITFSK
jgi:hypothetical protein